MSWNLLLSVILVRLDMVPNLYYLYYTIQLGNLTRLGRPRGAGLGKPGCRLGAVKIKAGPEQQEKNNTVAPAFHKWYKKVPQVAQKNSTSGTKKYHKWHKPAQKGLF